MISPIKDTIDYKSAEYVKTLIPTQSIVDTFLFYSGKLEFNLTQSDRIVRAHTNRYVVYEFWHCMQEDPERIINIALHLHERRDPVAMVHMQDRWYSQKDHYVRAALFFLLNCYSQNGLISSGKLSFRNFSPLLFNRIRNCSFENLRINFYKDEDPLVGLNYLEGGDYTIMPMGKYSYNLFEEGKSYGHESTKLDHVETKFKIDDLKEKIIVIYKRHDEVLKLYKDYNISMIDLYGNLTQNYEQCEEVVIANF